MRRTAFVCLAVCASLCCLCASAAEHPAIAAYEQLNAGEYSHPVALPDGGVEFSLDVATWRLESGTVRLMRPVAARGEPRPTGAVFEGAGRFVLEVPDPIELAHLRRSVGDPELTKLDAAFDRMVLRFSQPEIADAFAFAAGAGGFAPDKLAAEHHEDWMDKRRQDVDARIAAALVGERASYLWATMDTEAYDWLEFGFDGLDPEEMVLADYRPKYGFVEEWVRLDRAEDRLPDGRPTPDPGLRLDLEHLDARADLTRAAKTLSPLGKGEIQPRLADFDVTVRATVLQDLGEVLSLKLSPLATVRSVHRLAKGGTETELAFLRHQTGKTLSVISEDYNDRDLLVLFDDPVMAGDALTLRFDYELEVLNYVSGIDWYPAEENATVDLHTADVELLTRNKDEVRAMGEAVVAGEDSDAGRVWHYRISRPTRMVTFSFAEDFHEETVAQEGVPTVTAFANYGGKKVKKKAFNVAADLVNSVNFFQQIFGRGLPVDHLYATAVLGGHGQSFDGFLHLSEGTFLSESKGPTELFRAHEAAHQWWGHTVTPATYRDQWLSEGMAEYAAIAFLQVALENGQDDYDEIIEAYSGLVKGKVEKGSRYLRTWALQDNDVLRARVGPIGLGYRASTAETPAGYFTQLYVKGALVLHMLRTCLRSLTRDDDTFFAVLRDFLEHHAGGTATTADFVAAVERIAPGDWDWFFDQWILGTDIPTYRWSWDVAERDGKLFLDLDVEQHGVPAGFRMPVPLHLDLGGERPAEIVVMVDEPHERFSFEVPSKPRKVAFDDDLSVLAWVEEKK